MSWWNYSDWDYKNKCKPWEEFCYGHNGTTGKKQSPIDFDLKTLDRAVECMTPWKEVATLPQKLCKLKNTYQCLRVDGGFGSFKDFKALQFHFHMPAEHKLNGKQYAAEMHIVQQRSDGQFAVFGIFFEEGEENQFLKAIGMNSPPKSGGEQHPIEGSVDPYTAFKEQLTGPYFHYDGSLTTPPLTEVVSWFVFEKTATLSKEQIQASKHLFGPNFNARPCQPLGNRICCYQKYSIPKVRGQPTKPKPEEVAKESGDKSGTDEQPVSPGSLRRK